MPTRPHLLLYALLLLATPWAPLTITQLPVYWDLLSSHLDDPSVNWDHALSLTTADSSGGLFDTSLPFSSSDLIAPDSTLPDSTLYDWNSFPLPSSLPQTYSGDAHTPTSTSGVSSFDLTSGVQMDTLTMPPITPNLYESSQSTPLGLSTLPTPASSDRGLNHTARSSSGSVSTSPQRNSSSPELQPVSRASTKASASAADSSRIEKRKANTLAARRYRQKRVDQVTGLEAELKEVKAERDDMKVRCAKLEGEVEALRALLRAQK